MATSPRHIRPPSRHSEAQELFGDVVATATTSAESVTTPAPAVPAVPAVPVVAPEATPAVVEPAPVAATPYAGKQLDLTPYVAEEVTPVEAAGTPAAAAATPVEAAPAPVTVQGAPVDPEYARYQLEQRIRKTATERGLDPDDAVYFYDASVAPAVEASAAAMRADYETRLAEVASTVKKDVSTVSDQVAYAQQRQFAAARDNTNKQIMAVHPDATKILSSKAFVEAMSAPQPYGGASKMQQIVAAYENNDAAFITQHLQEYLHQQPDITSVAEVGQAMVATQPAATSVEETMSSAVYHKRMAELRSQKRTPEVLKEISTLAEAFATAQAAGRVN